jgi:hypothetical protein
MQNPVAHVALVDHARGLRDALEVEVFEDNVAGRAFYRAYGLVELRRGRHEGTGLGVVWLRLPGPRID